VLDLANPLPLEEIYDAETAKYTTFSPVRTEAKASPTSTQTTIPVPNVPAAATVEPKTADSPALQTYLKTIELQHYGTELLTRDAGTAIRADLAG
jgi:hypothetical protein